MAQETQNPTTSTEAIEALEATQIHHATKKKVLKLAAILDAEYPILLLHPNLDDDTDKVLGWFVNTNNEDFTVVLFTDTPKVPELADILDACEDLGIDPEEGAEDEPRATGSVVAEHYRVQYREVSTTGTTCGDWLAEWLVAHTLDLVSGLDVERFAVICVKNGADTTAKWYKLPESGQTGWVGRFRMCGRQAIEKHIAKAGFVIDHQGNKHELPADYAAMLRSKHAKWISKQERSEAAADALAESAPE